MINFLKNTDVFFDVLIIGNIIMYLFNILIHYFWNNLYNVKTLKITKSDVKSSLWVLLVNILIAIPGYLLFNVSYIKFTYNHFFIHLLLLFVGFDFFMYVLHYLSHTLKPLKILHKDHHSHTYFNIFSLYVMHPFEAVLFGVLLTVVSLLFTLNIYSFITFIIFNWLYGVIAHLNTESTKQPVFFGTHIFHKKHHAESNCNYGFYTVLWDRLFKSVYKTNSP